MNIRDCHVSEKHALARNKNSPWDKRKLTYHDTMVVFSIFFVWKYQALACILNPPFLGKY